MDDRAIVAAITGGDPKGLDRAYRRYADRLYAYSRSMVGDPDAARDVVQDVFILASQRIGQLREPDRLRAWLYAIARTESLHRLRDRKRMLPSELPDDAIAADTQDVTRNLHAEQVRELVRAAAGGLSEADREIIDLVIDYDFGPTDIAASLDISPNNAAARLSRARTGLGTCVGVLLVARTGKETCTDLAGQLGGWDGRLTPLLRKRLNRHIDGCGDCGTRRRDLLTPAALLGIAAAFPLLAVGEGAVLPGPAPLQDGSVAGGGQVGTGPAGPGRPADPHTPVQPPRQSVPPTSTVTPGGRVPPTSTITPGGRPPTSTVTPGGRVPPTSTITPGGPTSTIKPGGRRRRITATIVGAAVLLVLLLCGVLAVIRQPTTATFFAGEDPASEVQATPTGDPAGGASSTPDPGIGQPSGDPSPDGGGDGVTDPPPLTPSASSGAIIVIPAEMYVSASAVATCTSGSAKTYNVKFTARIFASSVDSASVIWHDPTRHREVMSKSGRVATYTATGLRASTFTYSVWVKAANGGIGDTDTRTKSNPCLSPSPTPPMLRG